MDVPDTGLVESPPEDYGVEVLCAGWNPLVAVAVEPSGRCGPIPADLSTADTENFLKQFYRCQES